MMSDVLVIKCRHAVRPERLRELRRNILEQKETGVVVSNDIKIVIDDCNDKESEETL